MSENLIFQGRTYISSRRAALKCGYSRDYIGQLIRSKKIEARMVGRSWFVSQESLDLYQQTLQTESILPQLNKTINKPTSEFAPVPSSIFKKIIAGITSLAVVGIMGAGYYFADASMLRDTTQVLQTTGQKINSAIVATYDDFVDDVRLVADAYTDSLSNVGEDLNTGVGQVVHGVAIVPRTITSAYMNAVVSAGDALSLATNAVARVDIPKTFASVGASLIESISGDTETYVAAIAQAQPALEPVTANDSNNVDVDTNSFVDGVKNTAVRVYDSMNNFFASLFKQDDSEGSTIVVNTPVVSTVVKTTVATSSPVTTPVVTVFTNNNEVQSSPAQPVQAINNYYTSSGVTPLTLATELSVLRADLEVKIRNAQHTAELAIENSRSSRDRLGERSTNTVTTVVQTNTLAVPTLLDGCVEVVGGVLTSVGAICGTGGSGVTTFNGLIASTQSFATTSNNGGWGFSSSVGTHTLNIPTASATNVLGLLSNTDWSTFNAKQAAGSYITALTGDATAAGPGSAAITLATVNGNVGSFGSSTAIPTFTVNAKGLITAAGTVAVVAPAGTLTGATLAANVLSSSLTSLGTIAQLAFTNASGTNATVSTNLYLPSITSSFLAVDQTGKVIATTTPSGGGGSGTVNSGTIGQVPYYAANGTAVTATSTLFLVNQNVGIGTTSPTNRLEVAGSGYFAGNLTAGNITATGTVSITNLANTILAVNASGQIVATTTSAGGVTAVTGTSNRITSTGGATPVIDISASYVGQTSITTLGTITTGVWNGTAIANANLANSTISGISLGSNLANLTATDTTLTFSGTYNGGTARTIGLNLGAANVWTASTTFAGGLNTTNSTTTNATTTTFAIRGLSSTVLAVDANGSVVATTTAGGGSGTVNSGLTGQVPYYAANGTAVTATSTLFLVNQNVGIGTTTPSDKLEIVTTTSGGLKIKTSDITGTSGLTLENSQSSVIGQIWKASTLYSGYKNLGASDFSLYTNTGNISFLNDNGSGNINFAAGGASTAQILLSSSGNFGIGTTSPTNKLEVAGSGYFAGNLTAGNITATGTVRITGLSSTVLAVDQNGNVIATTTAGGGSGTVNSGLTGQVPYYAANGTAVTATSTLFLVNQNVGIGTTSPTNRLEVNGSGYFAGNLTAGNITATGTITASGGTLTNVNLTNSNGIHTAAGAGVNVSSTLGSGSAYYMGSQVVMSYSGDGIDLGRGASYWQNVTFWTNNVYRGQFDNTGLAIGTTTATAKLSVHSGYGSRTPLFDISSTTSALFATSTVFRVNADGNVGIGTSQPQQLLHVYRSTDGPPVRFEDSNGYCEIDPTSTSWVCTSDRNLKKDIENISTGDSLARMSQLQAVSFKWKTQDSDDLRYGFIAQDVEAIFPELVSTASNGIKSVAYGGFTPFIIEAIKALNLSVEDIKTRVASVEERVGVIESMISSVGNVVQNTVAKFTTKELTVGDINNVAAAGITVIDRGTAQPACVYVENGVLTSRPGDCGAVTGVGNNNPITTTNDDTSGDTTTATSTATTTPEVVSEPVAEPTPEPAPEAVPPTETS